MAHFSMFTTGCSLRRQKGFTLIELLVALLIGSVVTSALFQTFSQQLAAQRVESARRAAQTTARGTMNFIVRNLEQLGREPNLILFTANDPAIQTANADMIQYRTNLSEAWADTDTNDTWENVTFQYSAGDKTVYVVANGQTTPLTDSGTVQKSFVPPGGLVFTYFDKDGNIVAPGGGAAARASIRRITVSLTVRGLRPDLSENDPNQPEVTLSQDVFLRNVS
jgi:prepilin-type N-terminal cleavage/methylation domain-containing protein